MSKELDIFQREMSRLVNQIDITKLFREKQANSLCSLLCDFREFDDPDTFYIDVQEDSRARVLLPKNKILNIKDNVERLLVPVFNVGCYPVLRLRDWRKPTTNSEHILDDAIQSLVNEIDNQLIRILISCGDNTPANSSELSTVVIHPSECNSLFGVDLWEEDYLKPCCKSYVISSIAGSIPKHLIYEDDIKQIEKQAEVKPVNQVKKVEHKGLQVIMSPMVPKNMRIYCEDKMAVLCHTPHVYAIPHIDAQRLTAGFVVADSIGLGGYKGASVTKSPE
jgi:hypothetical protein